MSIGPVEYIIVGFPGNAFSGDIAPELAKLVNAGIIRILDLVFVSKNAEGDVLVMEVDEHEALVGFVGFEGEAGGLIGSDDIEHAAFDLEPDSSAALLIWEDRWAGPLVDALRGAGGIVLEGARIPHELIELAVGELAAAE